MSEADPSSSDGSSKDESNPSEPRISFEKRTPSDSGPVYGAPDPKFATPQYGTSEDGASDGQFGPSPGAGYPPPTDGSGQFAPPPPPPPYGGSQYGEPQYPGPQYGEPQYAGPQYPGPQYGGPQYAGGPGFMDPMAPYGRHPVTGEPYSDKQKLTAGLLNILLGAFGAGRFYLNQPGIAVAQIAVTWLTCGIGGIWPLIDGIMMLTGSVRDQHGRPLRD